MAKTCKKGYYYCFTSKRCKKIPAGHHVMGSGRLMKDSEHDEKNGSEESTETPKNGNGNGDGGNGGSVSEGWSNKYKKSINCDNPKGFSQRAHCQGRKKKMNEGKEKQDHEVSMAKTQVKKSIDNLKKVARVLAKKSDSDNLPAWVQAKLTDTEHHTDAAASYMTNGDDVSEAVRLKNGNIKTAIDTIKKTKEYKKNPAPFHVFPSQIKSVDTQSFEPEGEFLEEKKKKGGTLHNWFGKSKSKDGKPGWVQSDGSPCANEPGETKTPKCYSSRRLAGLKKTEEGKKKIRSADARKSRKDPGQQQKSSGAAPTMVRTFTDKKDYKKHKSGDYREGFEMQEARDVKGKGSGKKDACYHKVKSRYSVWPSAYASGALVKCRKVGAANWGNSTRKEGFEFSNWRDDFKALEIETVDLIKAEPLVVNEAKKCWKGYEKKGTQKLFGKTYNRCVKKEEFSNWREELAEGAAWTRKEGQNKKGGLNEKGRKSYERENPGSDLKVPSKKVGNKRRASFCARMKGMKKKLTSKKTANDPNSRINKSLRAWNC